GGDDPDAVALDGADERERSAGASPRVLDDGAPGLQPTVRLRTRNRGEGHPVLDAPGGVLRLELHEDLPAVGGNDLAQSDHRRVADGLKQVHGGTLAVEPPTEGG